MIKRGDRAECGLVLHTRPPPARLFTSLTQATKGQARMLQQGVWDQLWVQNERHAKSEEPKDPWQSSSPTRKDGTPYKVHLIHPDQRK